MFNHNLDLSQVGKSFAGFLDGFKQDLLMEVKSAVRTELGALNVSQKSSDETLSRHEAAKLLNCSLTTLCHYQRVGSIPYYKVGKKVIFKRQELLEAIRRQVRKGGHHE